jgi:hypothetical protein
MEGEMMELLKAIKEMMDANQAKMDADREERKAKADTDQEEILAEMREEIKSGQMEMRSTVSAIAENMEATIHSLRAWREEMWPAKNHQGPVQNARS